MERRLHLFWPLTLIAAGVLWIMIEVGTIPVANLWVLTYLWPVLLIGAGLGILLRPYWRYSSTVIGALMVIGLFLAVVFAQQLGWNRFPRYALNGVSIFSGPAQRGSGHVITQDRTVQGFTGIHISYPATYVIKQGATESLTIQAEDNVVAAINTQVQNGVLDIAGVRDHIVQVSATQPVQITITVKDLKSLNFDSAGDVTIQGLKTDSLTTVLDGAGSMVFNNLQLSSLTANLSGVGSFRPSGTVDTLTVRVDGLGSFDGAGLHSQSATVNLDGMGSATVWVDSQLTANVNGMGSVNYYGSAQVSRSVNGLGTVHYMGTK